MNKNPATKQFWRVCGPLLLYWLIQFVAQCLVEFIMILPHANEIAQSMIKASQAAPEKSIQIIMQGTEGYLNGVLKYQTEIAAVIALCTIPLTLYLFCADRKRERTLQIPANKKAEPLKYAEIVALGIAVSIGMTCLMVMTNLAFTDSKYQETAEAFYSASVPVQLLCTGLIIPVAEELMFRGVLYKRYREQSRFFMAALYAAILFGLSHANSVQFIYALILGLLLAYVYEKFGSFKAPVLLHIVANVTSLLVTEAGGFTWLLGRASRLGMATVACAFVGSVMFVLIQRIDEKPEIEETEDKNQKPPEMFR